MAGWTLESLHASSYELVASCCRRYIVIGAPELEDLIRRYGADRPLLEVTARSICRECRSPLDFVVRPRGQATFDWPRPMVSSQA